MADETLRSIYSAADETIAQLDQLHRASRERVLSNRLSLDAAVARLGDSTIPFVDDLAEAVSRPPADGTVPSRNRPVADETPFVALPQRTTHGGPWGPAMVRKLTAEALAKDTRWR